MALQVGNSTINEAIRCTVAPLASQAADYNLDHAMALYFAKNEQHTSTDAAADPFAGYVDGGVHVLLLA